MAATEVLQTPAALLEELSSFQAAAQATLTFACSILWGSHPPPPELPQFFPCPVDPHHRIPPAALAPHSASCQAAEKGCNLTDLFSTPPGASNFFYTDAPGVVQLRRLPVDQPPRPPLPPQPGPPQPCQSFQEGLLSSSDTRKEGGKQPQEHLQEAIRRWEGGRNVSAVRRFAAEQEVESWRALPSPLPPEAGRLLGGVPEKTLASLIQRGAAEGEVGVTAAEGGALGTLLTWQGQEIGGGEGTQNEGKRQPRVLSALLPLVQTPAAAPPFLLCLWQHVLGGVLRSLPPPGPPPPLVNANQVADALETLREGVRRRQQLEQAARPPLLRAERLAQYDAGVQIAALVRVQRPSYRPLPDHDWLFRPHDPNQPQSSGGRRNRMELLAELRDLKRRTTSYRAKKQRTPLQSARDLIELRMMQLEEAFGLGGQDDQAGSRDTDRREESWGRDEEEREGKRKRESREEGEVEENERDGTKLRRGSEVGRTGRWEREKVERSRGGGERHPERSSGASSEGRVMQHRKRDRDQRGGSDRRYSDYASNRHEDGGWSKRGSVDRVGGRPDERRRERGGAGYKDRGEDRSEERERNSRRWKEGASESGSRGLAERGMRRESERWEGGSGRWGDDSQSVGLPQEGKRGGDRKLGQPGEWWEDD